VISQLSLLNRRVEIPVEGIMTDLVWSDPNDADEWLGNPRGFGQLFGITQSRMFCWLNRIIFIARAHQTAQLGFETHHGDSTIPYRVLTIFSAPCYDRGNNQGAFLAFRCNPEDPQRIVQFQKAKSIKI
jgi:diadenosine tetraphosphatase ApaH/serine/threonine PP2A family protein phosphatase